MQEADDEDEYSDNDLDALPSDTLYELQQDAIRSTQKVDRHERPKLPVMTRQPRPPPAHLNASLANLGNAFHNTNAQSNSHQPSSDYGDFDDEMLDGEIFDAADEPLIAAGHKNNVAGRPVGEGTQREQWRQQRYGALPEPQLYGRDQKLDLGGKLPVSRKLAAVPKKSSNNRDPQTLREREEIDKLAGLCIQDSTAMGKLEAQVQQLMQERDELQNAYNSANSTLQAKAGEIAILRANQIKVDKENEKKLAALQKLNVDEATRHKGEIDEALDQYGKIRIEKSFLEFDQKVTKKVGYVGPLNDSEKESPFTTPKKNKAFPYRDGFNDDEIQMVSPTKLTIRSKPGTPKIGAKRKRKPAEGSPAQPLPLSQAKNDEHQNALNKNLSKDASEVIVKTVNQDDEKFQYTQRILNHRIERDQKRSFEALSDYAYPSDPTKVISTLLLDKFSELTFKTNSENFPCVLGNIIIALWCRCVDEECYGPAHLLMDLIKYILLISPPCTGLHFTDIIVVCAQKTADVNVIRRFQRTPASALNPDADAKESLEILLLIAYDCIQAEAEIAKFWRRMRFDFVIMMLNIAQPIDELNLAIRLLRTSILEASFAMIVPPGDGTQDKSEAVVIDRLSRLLVEVPVVDDGAKPYSVVEISDLRLQVLALMQNMCDKKHSGEALATHKDLISRLVRVMNDQLAALYDYQYGHENRSELVNQSTRLLFHLTTTYSGQIDMQAKLRVIPGGTHKYLIALSRLAFTESIFYERGIEEDVADCAHQMLETLVNPQEAEALLEAFSSTKKQ